MRSCDITILGGLPVTVEFSVVGPDPSVGDPGGVEEWYVTYVNGRPVKKPPEWLYARIRATKGEERRIIDACMESADDYLDRADYEYEKWKDERP